MGPLSAGGETSRATRLSWTRRLSSEKCWSATTCATFGTAALARLESVPAPGFTPAQSPAAVRHSTSGCSVLPRLKRHKRRFRCQRRRVPPRRASAGVTGPPARLRFERPGRAGLPCGLLRGHPDASVVPSTFPRGGHRQPPGLHHRRGDRVARDAGEVVVVPDARASFSPPSCRPPQISPSWIGDRTDGFDTPATPASSRPFSVSA